MTVPLPIYLIVLILFLYMVYIFFGTIAQLIDPTFAPRLQKKYNRWRYFRYARKYGMMNAYHDLKNIKYIADALEPWEHAKFKRKDSIRNSQLLAYIWKSQLLAVIGFYHHPELKIFGRWLFIKEGVIGMLIDWELLSVNPDPKLPPIEHVSA